MSIWRKIVGLFFEENDAVMVDDELEDISFADEVVVSKKPSVKAKEEYNKQEEHKSVDVNVHKQSFVEPLKETPSTNFINVDVVEEKTNIKKEVPTRTTKRPVTTSVIKEEKKDYEFSPVISPIFGSKEDDEKHKGTTKSQVRPQKKHVNPLGTVISPYFGLGELEEFKVEAQEHIEKKEKLLQSDLPIEEMEQFEEDDDVNSISLDDMIVEQETDEEDDMMQISLFGEATSLRESDEEKKVK